tara:strand:- start:330 stop:668 length:339 start_codon:yes stop_codon:yes gene_type:complete
MSTVKIKADDTAIEFTNPAGEPLEIDGVTVNLTGASIKFLLRMLDAPYTQYSLTAAIDGTATDGNVTYTLGTGFPTTPGQYRQEWQVTFADSTILTFPSSGYNVLEIVNDLN